MDEINNSNYCYFWLFQINIILLAMIVKVFLQLKSNAKTGEWERAKRGVRAIVLLTPLLGITWIFGALAIDEATKWFLYLFSIFNSLQVCLFFSIKYEFPQHAYYSYAAFVCFSSRLWQQTLIYSQ